MTMRLDAVGVRGGATKIGSAGEDLKQVFDTLKAVANTITFDSGESGYAPDIDRIDVPKTSS